MTQQDLGAEVERALAGRQGRKVGDEIKFLCPAHSDENPSAEFNRRKDCWNCPVCGAGGPTRDLAKLLGIAIAAPRPDRWEFVCAYDYRDANGVLLYQVVRQVNEATGKKKFAQRHPDGRGGWVWKKVPHVPYRVPELLRARGRRIYIAEGEKDVDSLAALGLAATTLPEGASAPGARQKWKPDLFLPYIDGAPEIVLLPDNDDAGEALMEFVAQALAGFGGMVKVLRLPGLGPKGDVSDWLLAGGDEQDLEALADGAPEWAPPAEPVGASAFAPTDAGNAELFEYLFGDRVRFDHQQGRWLLWDEHRWGGDPDGALWRLAVDAARQRARASADLAGDAATASFRWAKVSESAAKVEAMFKHLRSRPLIADRGKGWDANPMLLGVANGVVNLATGEFRAGRKEDRVTRSCGLVYDPEARCPRWLAFLEQVFQGDQETIAFIQRAVGYSLTGSTKEQVWFLCYGDGANGKSTFLETLLALLGGALDETYGADIPADTIMKKGMASNVPADIAMLAGKRFVICSESDSIASLNTARVKSLTGGDPQTARFMRQNFFTFLPQLKLWLATNHLPRVNDPTDGFWRRVRLIPFLAKFEGAKRDSDLRDKLRAELAGILLWAIRGAMAWSREGLQPPQSVMLATLRYKHDSDPLGEFKTERCIAEEGARATPMSLYNAYKAWCEHEGISERERLGRNTFLRALNAEGFKSVKTNGIRGVLGIRLREEGETAIADDTTLGDVSTDSQGRIEGPLGIERERYSLAWGHTELHVPSVPLSLNCECDATHDTEEGCEGRGYWEDGAGELHCWVCHPPAEAGRSGMAEE